MSSAKTHGAVTLDASASSFLNLAAQDVSIADEATITSGATTNAGLAYVLDSLTTGSGLKVTSNSSDATARTLVDFQNQNTSATGTIALGVQQKAANEAVFIDQDANAQALLIDAETTTARAVDIDAQALTLGDALYVQSDSVTSGHLGAFYSNSADTSQRALVLITNDNALATGTSPLQLVQDAEDPALHILSNEGDAIFIDIAAAAGRGIDMNLASNDPGIRIEDTGVTTDNTIDIASDALTTGRIAHFSSDSSDASTRSLVRVTNDNTSAVGATGLEVVQDAANQIMILDHNATAAGSSYIDFQGTEAANATGPISTFTTSGGTTHHIQIEINGTKAWIAASTTDPS